MDKWKYISIKNINDILKEKKAAPLKKWGQNFLIDLNIIEFIIQEGKIGIDTVKPEAILEIGPGLGSITHKLQVFSKDIYLFEIDPILIEILKSNSMDAPPYHLLEGDVLKNIYHLPETKYYCFGNLPYYISTDILVSLFKCNREMLGGIFMLQREFVERVVSGKSSLSIFLNALGSWKSLKNISPKCFYPSPNAESSLVKFEKFANPILNSEELTILELILRGFFWGKRKTIQKCINENPFFGEDERKNLLGILEETKILSGKERAEEIPGETYYKLAKLSGKKI